MILKVLSIGDCVGKMSRKALARLLPDMRKEFGVNLVCVNAENISHGSGITEKHFRELQSYGVDFVTLGDHAFDKDEARELLEKEKNSIIRPANFPPHMPGSGEALIEAGSKKILIVNLLGRVFMKMDYDCPFREIDTILNKYKNIKISAILVDFHAEATSEKKAFALFVDGRVTLVAGTHTHIPTADHCILPGGTAAVSDIGMVGARDSCIGVDPNAAIRSFLDQTKYPLEPVEEGVCVLNSVLTEIDTDTKKAIKIQRVDRNITIE